MASPTSRGCGGGLLGLLLPRRRGPSSGLGRGLLVEVLQLLEGLALGQHALEPRRVGLQQGFTRQPGLISAVLGAIPLAVLADAHDLVHAHHAVRGRVHLLVVVEGERRDVGVKAVEHEVVY